MLISLCTINEYIDEKDAIELGYFNNPHEAALASYHLLSWMGKSGLPISEQLAIYTPIRDKRLRVIEDLVWELYWVKIADDIFIDNITLTHTPASIHVNFNSLWSL